MDQTNQPTLIRRFILGAIIVILLVVLYWVSQQSRLTIQIENSGTYEAVLINQKSREEKLVSIENGSKSVYIPKGDYQVVVTGDDNSYVEVISTSGFFRNKNIDAAVKKENPLQIVGMNPLECSYYDAVLVSFACRGYAETVAEHKPPNGSNPTHRLSARGIDKIPGTIQDYSEINGNHVYLVKRPRFSEGAPNVLVTVKNSDGSVQVDQTYALNQLDENREYSLKPFKSGFVVYDNGLDKMFFFDGLPSNNSSSEDGVIVGEYSDNKPDGLDSIEVASYDNKLAVSFSNRSVIDNENEKTKIFVGDLESLTEYEFDVVLNDITLCGNDRICALSKDELHVYSLSGSKAKLVYRIVGVKNYQSSFDGNSLYITQDQRVLSINTESRSGFVSVSHPDFRADFISSLSDSYGYIVHLRNSSSLIGVRVSEGEANDDSVLSVINTLQMSPLITSVSVYGKEVLIAPNLGEIIYLEDTREYNYDPKRKSETNAEITKIIQEAGLIESGYSVINVLN